MNTPRIMPFFFIITQFVGFSYCYVYCDPFSHSKILRCVCAFLDYADTHSPADAKSREPLLCQRYEDFKTCSKGISLVCKFSVIGNLEKLYETLCHSSYKGKVRV